MKVILLKELRGKGGEGDIIDVAPGFANNFLLTEGYAIKATPGNIKQLEAKRKNIAKREETRIADAEALKAQLDAARIPVEAQIGEEPPIQTSWEASPLQPQPRWPPRPEPRHRR